MIVGLAATKYDLYKLFAGVAKGNVASQKVLEKNGFTLEVSVERTFTTTKISTINDYGLVLSERCNMVNLPAD